MLGALLGCLHRLTSTLLTLDLALKPRNVLTVTDTLRKEFPSASLEPLDGGLLGIDFLLKLCLCLTKLTLESFDCGMEQGNHRLRLGLRRRDLR